MRYITALRKDSGAAVAHITECLILNGDDGKTMKRTPKSIAELIVDSKIAYCVGTPTGSVQVEAVHVAGRPHHIRTAPNDTTEDNLLKLPRY